MKYHIGIGITLGPKVIPKVDLKFSGISISTGIVRFFKRYPALLRPCTGKKVLQFFFSKCFFLGEEGLGVVKYNIADILISGTRKSHSLTHTTQFHTAGWIKRTLHSRPAQGKRVNITLVPCAGKSAI